MSSYELIGMGGCDTAVLATEWTVMVYMNADNNLECFGMQDLKEMVQALTGTSAANMPNVVVLSDRGPEQCDNRWIPSAMLSEIPSGVCLSVPRQTVVGLRGISQLCGALQPAGRSMSLCRKSEAASCEGVACGTRVAAALEHREGAAGGLKR
jgi:hypothetical protein